MEPYSPEFEETMRRYYNSLNEKDGRRFAGLEALRFGQGGRIYIAQVLGCSRNTVSKGAREVSGLPKRAVEQRIRKPGGGRKPYYVTWGTQLDEKFLEVLREHTAGDPMDEKVRWTNLTPGEIVGQVMLARDSLGEWPKGSMAGLDEVEDSAEYTSDGRLLTNIVLMGMGEPLYNFDNVRDAMKLVMDGDGLALSKRRITLSTSGVVPMMERCGEEIGVNLAVSLHAVRKDIRDEIVPLNKKYGIEELLQACADYPGASNARRITFEYIMLKDKNDSDEDARELVRLLKQYDLPAKVNLIPFNPWPGSDYETSLPERIRAFSDIVFEGGISAPVRTPRGRDIGAACGQLKTAAEKKSRAQRDREAAEAAEEKSAA